MSAPKQYGLILPGQQPKKKPIIPQRDARPSIFDESDEDSSDGGGMPPHLQPPSKKSSTNPHGPGMMEQRIAKQLQEKALKEDPTCFQYDELYDDMETKRTEEKQTRSLEPKKPKYISRLMEHAERRKLENELRVERQVQKEREQEGEQFKDKESFVTSAYRKKLEEMRKLEEEEKRDEYLESIGDVTKQKDLDGFYRHLYEQKTGSTKEVHKPSLGMATSAGDDEIAYKPISSGKRAYRKRQASQEEEEKPAVAEPNDSADKDLAASEAKKIHLPNNIDADSDFSIDSSSDESDADEVKSKPAGKEKSPEPATTTKGMALNLEAIKKESIKEEKEAKDDKDEKLPAEESTPPPEEKPPKPKKDKKKVWEKRTLGEVFEAAVQRYFERKAARSG